VLSEAIEESAKNARADGADDEETFVDFIL